MPANGARGMHSCHEGSPVACACLPVSFHLHSTSLPHFLVTCALSLSLALHHSLLRRKIHLHGTLCFCNKAASRHLHLLLFHTCTLSWSCLHAHLSTHRVLSAMVACIFCPSSLHFFSCMHIFTHPSRLPGGSWQGPGKRCLLLASWKVSVLAFSCIFSQSALAIPINRS